MCDYEALKSAVNEKALKVCGRVKLKRVEWLTDNIKQLAALKLAKFKEWQSLKHVDVKKSEVYDEYRLNRVYKLNRESIAASKAAKNAIVKAKGKELEEMEKINNTRAVYQKVSELKGTRSVQADMLRNEDGTVVHGCVERKERWMRHFKNLLNVESRVENGLHTFEGPKENRNEPGFDNISPETLKAGGSILSRWIHSVISKIWESKDIPEDWLRAIVVPLFKKEDKSICDNWSISLLSVVGKVFKHNILRSLEAVVDPKISECQAGFRKARGCAD
jgi:hypothetical protein